MARTKPDTELSQQLRAGDRIRLAEFPLEFRSPAALHLETREAYKYLLNRRGPLTVYMIDE